MSLYILRIPLLVWFCRNRQDYIHGMNFRGWAVYGLDVTFSNQYGLLTIRASCGWLPFGKQWEINRGS